MPIPDAPNPTAVPKCVRVGKFAIRLTSVLNVIDSADRPCTSQEIAGRNCRRTRVHPVEALLTWVISFFVDDLDRWG